MNNVLVSSKYALPPERFLSISSKFMLEKISYNFLTEHEKDTKFLMKYFSNNKKDKIGNISGLR